MRAESWTMWVIVSSWRLRGYCRRKWPSWIQVALSIPLRSLARLATPLSRSLSLSLSSLPTSLPPPPFCSVCSFESVISPCFSLFRPSPTSPRVVFLPSFLARNENISTPILPKRGGRGGRLEQFVVTLFLFLFSLSV